MTNKAEFDLINNIASRATVLAKTLGVRYPKHMALMDLTTVHASVRPLRLAELLIADDGNFGHDVFGIRRHLNRQTGRLEDCFVPRYTQPE